MTFLADTQLGASGGASAVNYIEDVFSTYLYTGTGATQTITNGIDLSTKGGLVWIKDRTAINDHKLTDTVRGATKAIISDTTGAQTTDTTGLTAFSTTGFTIGSSTIYNTSADNYVSWTFRKQAKFFDIVTYTGTGSATTIAHNLGSTPGFFVVKRIDTTSDWPAWHRSLPSNLYYLRLNSTGTSTDSTMWNNTAPTSTVFSVGTNVNVNASGGTYVAYLFAHEAGGFGANGTDNVISCGSMTLDGSGNGTVTVPFEPQFMLAANAGFSWVLDDVMRGWTTQIDTALRPNNTSSEGGFGYKLGPTTSAQLSFSGGFAGNVFYYVIIRRGPMKTPTSGTSVFNPTKTGGGVATVTTNFAPDSVFFTDNFRSGGSGNPNSQSNPVIDKLRGPLLTLSTMAANGDQTQTSGVVFNNTGFVESLENSWSVANDCTYWSFVRAPQFFDEVCYTGTGAATTVTHNLGAVPELIFVKQRSAANSWWVYNSTLGNTKYTLLNSAAAPTTSATAWNNTTPTASVFTVGTAANVNGSGSTYIAYLFATLAGVSKVGTYTGTGSTTQTINCGFPSGVRFVLIKRTDVTGDWYCFDTANGMTSSSSPYLLWDSGAAQTTGNNGCYSAATGFTLTSAAAATVNVNTGTYIYLAIA